MPSDKTNNLKADQDRFTPEELSEVMLTRKLGRGNYMLDIADDGTAKISRIKKYWVQKVELISENK